MLSLTINSGMEWKRRMKASSPRNVSMSSKTLVPETQASETELAALLDEARQHVERLRRLEAEAKQLVADLRARAFSPALLPWSYRWRHVLANLAGVRLGRLYHHA